jgi:hypothetical protein
MVTKLVDLDQLDALEKAAPVSPWIIDSRDNYWAVTYPPKYPLEINVAFDDGSACGEYGHACSDKTRDFIIALRNAYPAMAEELRRLRGLVREYAEARDNCRVVQSRSGEVSPLAAAGDALYAAGKEIAK